MSGSGASSIDDALAQLGVTTKMEESEIASNLNASMFQAMLIGLYTVIYCGTMYIYITKGTSRRYLVPATVTLLYLCNLAQFGLQWNAAKQQFIDNGASRGSVFLSLYSAPLNLWIPTNLLNVVVLLLGDGLLIWRCYNVWNCSLRVISIPILLVITEGALLIASTIGIIHKDTEGALMDKISAAGFLMAACTTVITTSLIAYRVYSFLENKDISSRRFRHVVDIVIQSGAVYALSLVVVGTSVMLAPSTFEDVTLYSFTVWTQSFAFLTAGISTAIMVARVAMINEESYPPTSVHLSGLNFGRRSSIRTGSAAQLTVDISPRHGINGTSSSEGEKGSETKVEEKMVQNA